jgi:hypothetical protein
MLGLLWIEHGHRVVIGSRAAADVSAPLAQACSDETSARDANCVAFADDDGSLGLRPRETLAASSSSASDDRVRRRGRTAAACPESNENGPYSADCLRFISGWFFQPFPQAMTVR